jgi:hypothetical protein
VRQDHPLSTNQFQKTKLLKVPFYPHYPHFPVRLTYLEGGAKTRKAGAHSRELTALATHPTMKARGVHSLSSSPLQYTTAIEVCLVPPEQASEGGQFRYTIYMQRVSKVPHQWWG